MLLSVVHAVWLYDVLLSGRAVAALALKHLLRGRMLRFQRVAPP